jgi:hypothetical protein
MCLTKLCRSGECRRHAISSAIYVLFFSMPGKYRKIQTEITKKPTAKKPILRYRIPSSKNSSHIQIELATIQQDTLSAGRNSSVCFRVFQVIHRANDTVGIIMATPNGLQTKAQQVSLISHKGRCRFSSIRIFTSIRI